MNSSFLAHNCPSCVDLWRPVLICADELWDNSFNVSASAGQIHYTNDLVVITRCDTKIARIHTTLSTWKLQTNCNCYYLINSCLQAGYDTINSIHHFIIPGSFSSTATGSNSIFRRSSNVNLPGRWAFRTDDGSRGCTFNGKIR